MLSKRTSVPSQLSTVWQLINKEKTNREHLFTKMLSKRTSVPSQISTLWKLINTEKTQQDLIKI